MTSKQKKILISLLVLIGIISISYSFYFHIRPAVDARAYDNIGWNIAQGNGYRENLDVPLSEDMSIIRVGPGYEFFLAGIFYIFGHHLEAVWILQALLVVFSSWLIFVLGREVFKNNWNYRLGLISVILVGLSPDLITMQGMTMSETLGIFLIILSAYLFFKYYNNTSRPFWFVALIGLTLGAAGMVRTPSLFVFVPMAGYFVLTRKYKNLIIFTLFTAILFIPWTVRNYKVFCEFIPTNAAGGWNLLTGNHHGASGEQGDGPEDIFNKYIKELGYLKANDKVTKEAISFVIHNPIEFSAITLKRISIYFSFARPTGFWFHLHGLSKAITLISSATYSAILFIFGLSGIYKILKLEVEDRKRGWYFLAFLVMMPLAIIGIVVETRYRLLAYPFLAIFASLALDDVFNKKIIWKPTLIIASLLFLNTAIDIIRNLERIMDKVKTL